MDYEELAGKLVGEYHRVFDEVEAYAIIKNYVGEEKEELMMDLLDMLLTAQTEGKDVDKIVGTDVKKFCDNYFSVFNKRAGRAERLIRTLFLYACLGLANCALDLFDDNLKFVGLTRGAKTDWTVLVFCFGVAFVVSTVLEIVFGIIYRNKLPKTDKLAVIILITAVASAIIGIVTATQCNAAVLLPLVPAVVVCILVMVVCLVCMGVNNYRKYGSVRKPKEKKAGTKVLAVSGDDDISSEYEQMLVNEFASLYKKKNAKRLKKNEPVLTPEEFMDFLENENVKLKKDSRRMPFIWGIICIVCTAGLGMVGGYESFVEGIYFLGLLAAFMFIIYYFIFAKFFYGKILRDRVQLFDKCRRNNKTVLDYSKDEK